MFYTQEIFKPSWYVCGVISLRGDKIYSNYSYYDINNYSFCLFNTFDSAAFYKWQHDLTVDGPNKSAKRQIKRSYNKSVRESLKEL